MTLRMHSMHSSLIPDLTSATFTGRESVRMTENLRETKNNIALRQSFISQHLGLYLLAKLQA